MKVCKLLVLLILTVSSAMAAQNKSQETSGAVSNVLPNVNWGPPANVLARITVSAGDIERVNTPVSVELGDLGRALKAGEYSLILINGDHGYRTPSQIEDAYPHRMWWILKGTTPAGAKRTFEIYKEKGPKQPTGIQIKRDDKALDITCGDASILRYNHALMQPPKGKDPKYVRSAFIHPVYAPDGQVLTRIHPKDHTHHMGLWNPWTKTHFEGKEVDFWNIARGLGTVRFVKFADTTEGPVFGGFRAIQEHVAFNTKQGEKVALVEKLDIRVWNIGGGKKGPFLWDFTTTQRCASSSPLTLDKYRYGGLGFRATEAWTKDNANYEDSEGRKPPKDQGQSARWCNVFGAPPEGPTGILFLGHPENQGHPEPIRIWPNHKDGLFFNFTPIQKAEWVLKPGEDYTLRYRFYVYDGETSPETSERLWQDFANPPEVKMETIKK